MSESMLREEISVYSEKHNVHGVVQDYGVVTKLYITAPYIWKTSAKLSYTLQLLAERSNWSRDNVKK